jgi:HlyD family secretion protein
LSRALIASLVNARLPNIPHGDVSAESADDPQPELRFGMIVAGVFFVGFLGWAALAPMDQAAYASGKVGVAGHRQTVQHREGGVVSAIYVKEGQQVQKDQVLVQLAGGDIEAQERSLAATVIGLKAQRARLIAEQLGGPIQWPAEFSTLVGPDLEEAQRAMKIQTAQFNARASTQAAQGGVYGQRAAQHSEEIKGYERQIASTDTQIRLINEEIVGMKTLNERGFAPMTQVRALERQLAQLQSQRASLAASIAAAREQIGETRLENVQATRTQQEDTAKQIRDVDFQLNDALPKYQAAHDQFARTQIRAPATGAVVGLTVFNVGSVVAPGQKVLDVVPAKAPLVLEAQVSPNDADDLHIGQVTEVKFTGMHERSLPKLTGTLTRISADSFTDEKTGQSYFTAEVTVPLAEVEALRKSRGPDFDLKPGMPAQVLVPLRKRTALQYLFEPLTDAMWKSFREH